MFSEGMPRSSFQTKVKCLGFRPQYAGGFKNDICFIFLCDLALRPHLLNILHENGTFWKRSSNRSNLKTLALCFSADGKDFESEAFDNRWRYKSKMSGGCCVSVQNFPGLCGRKTFDEYSARAKDLSFNQKPMVFSDKESQRKLSYVTAEITIGEQVERTLSRVRGFEPAVVYQNTRQIFFTPNALSNLTRTPGQIHN